MKQFLSLVFTLLGLLGVVSPSKNVTSSMESLFVTHNSEFSNHLCKTRGRLPPWIKGTLIRNGVGKFEVGDTSYTHLFDGYAKLHSFKINDSEVLFSSRFLQTNSYNQSTKANKMSPHMNFDTTIPPFSTMQNFEAITNGADNTNVNIVNYGGDFVAICDFWVVHKFDGSSLEDVSIINDDIPSFPKMAKNLPLLSTAHPLPEYGSNAHLSVVSIASPLSFGSSTNIVRIHSATKRELVASIPVKRASFMHSFGLSENYAILFADPAYIDFSKVLFNPTFINSMAWEPERGTTVYVVHLKTGNVREFHINATLHMHHINSFESGNVIYVDYVTHTSVDVLWELSLDALRDPAKRRSLEVTPIAVRYKIDLNTGSIEQVRNQILLESDNFDFPNINENVRSKRNCYIYGLQTSKYDAFDFSIIKRDMCNGKHQIWKVPGHFPSEPIFIPNPSGINEDDGVVMSVVLDGIKQKSYLLTLDARKMKRIAKSITPDIVPYSLHGQFFDNL